MLRAVAQRLGEFHAASGRGGLVERALQCGGRLIQRGEGDAFQRGGLGGFALEAVGVIDTLGCGEYRLPDDPGGVASHPLIDQI